ncbi:MAG: phage tail tape measure protein, partial [Propionibacteriaceae bacterium]
MASGSEGDVGLRLRLFGRQEVRRDLQDTSEDVDDLGTRGERAAKGLAAIGDKGIAAGIRGISAAGKVAAVGLGVALGAAGALAKGLYEVGSVFDDVGDTIRAGTGAQGQALEDLNNVALSIGKTIPASFEDIGSTVADLNTRLGLTGDPLQHVASQMLALKNLGLETDINTITGAMSAYGVANDQVGDTLDQLFRVSQATGVGVNELATAAQSGAPALSQFGFSIGDSAALIGTLDKAGVDSAGTIGALRKGLGAFAKAGKDPQQALRDTVDGIDSLVKSGKDAEAINLAAGVFGTKGAAQFVAAIKSGKVNLDALQAGVGATDDTILGLSAETADFAEQWQLFKNVLLVAVKPAGDLVFGAIGEQMTRVTDGVRTLTDDLPALKTNLAGLLDSGTIGELGPQLEAAFKLPPGTLSGLQGPLDSILAKADQIAIVLGTAFGALQSIPISPLNLANDALGWAATHTEEFKNGLIVLASVYGTAKVAALAYAGVQLISNVRTAVGTGLMAANNAVYALSRSYIATWIGVKGLELGAWIRSTAASGASTIALGANRVAYGVSYLMTWLAVKGLEVAAWAR